jgi:hypothetical protein
LSNPLRIQGSETYCFDTLLLIIARVVYSNADLLFVLSFFDISGQRYLTGTVSQTVSGLCVGTTYYLSAGHLGRSEKGEEYESDCKLAYYLGDKKLASIPLIGDDAVQFHNSEIKPDLYKYVRDGDFAVTATATTMAFKAVVSCPDSPGYFSAQIGKLSLRSAGTGAN